jgi:23S rRNA (cytidine2498-2'-O)-methyltransferase
MRKGHRVERNPVRRHRPPQGPPAVPHSPTPARVRLPPPPRTFEAPAPGAWVWTCRAGFEAQLYEELAWARARPTFLAPALVASAALEGPPPAFARTGFPVAGVARTASEALALLPAEPLKVQAWSPDTPAGNALAREGAGWLAALEAARPGGPATPWKAFEAGAWLGQVCLVAPGLALVGAVRARDAVSLAAGGRSRMPRTGDAPSRAAMKLDEALDWYGLAPGKGELCVDLGSAPGGWTRRLLDRGARVWSVDTGQLAPDLRQHPRVQHLTSSAFDFEPQHPADWLFCDLAWRPLEVAQLLAKWARRRWATQLVANLKLPMKDKLPVVRAARALLEAGGWEGVRVKQLYHDRDEVTVTARLRG